MIHWFVISIGTILFSLGLSSPLFNLIFIKKNKPIKLRINFKLMKIIFISLGLIIIFFGLFIESLNI